jgi:N-acetylgalactosamine kinase
MSVAKNQLFVHKTVVIILAAGKGTRMGNEETAKVCFEIDGEPAINRIISIFKRVGFQNFVLVVGTRSEQVMQTVSQKHKGIVFVFQNPQMGTGHAAMCAGEVLESLGHSDLVLLCMGDKYLEIEAIEILVEGFIRKQADLALLTLPYKPNSKSQYARVIGDESGGLYGIVEHIDLMRLSIIESLTKLIKKNKTFEKKKILEVINEYLPNKSKQKKVIPELLRYLEGTSNFDIKSFKKQLVSDTYKISISGKNMSVQEINKCTLGINPSLYLSKSEAFYSGLKLLDNHNVQKEYYLTDIISHLNLQCDEDGGSLYRLAAVNASDPNIVQGFNAPDELLAIQDYFRRKKEKKLKQSARHSSRITLKENQYRKVSNWLILLEKNENYIHQWMVKIYGDHPELHKQIRKNLIKVLKCYGDKFGTEQKVLIVRAPARVNLMGRHVDHRGGFNNFLAIHRETFIVAGVRNDDNVIAVNIEPGRFKDVEFNISELIGHFAWSDWINFIESSWVRGLLRSSVGDWGNYIKAAVLRLQNKYQDIKLSGLNIALSGNIPQAAGLSSSSSIVVAMLQGAIALNGLELNAQQFVDMCGEGEWFVGSRGGAGDHAAIYLGERGKIAHVGYLPFQIYKMIDAPSNYQVIIANSQIKAAKSGNAKNTFNQKVCSFNLGLELLKIRIPFIKENVEYLRDIAPDNLGCLTSDIYKWLKKIPQYMTRTDFRQMLPGKYSDVIDLNFSTHKDPKIYNVRGVLFFGIAEIIRSKISVELLEKGKMKQFGVLMQISHDGDRVSARNDQGKYISFKDSYDDICLNQLIDDLASENPEKVLNAQLYMQPGGYGCSTQEIDRMIDISKDVQGVIGAQIAGAGLGGCIMILSKKESINDVSEALKKHYYDPIGLEPEIINCFTVEGSGLVEF